MQYVDMWLIKIIFLTDKIFKQKYELKQYNTINTLNIACRILTQNLNSWKDNIDNTDP